MPILEASVTIAYGDTLPATGTVPWRKTFPFSLTYNEESIKTVAIPASTTDFLLTLDTVTAPKFIFMRAIDVDVTVKYSDGTDEVATALSATSGWLMIVNPNGQPMNRFLVTTPASPTTGAHVQVLAFE
jgi:hypothetical protein